MIGRCSPDSQHGRSDRHPANVGCSFFRYLNDDIKNHNHLRSKRKTWTREDNKLARHYYSRSNPSQRRYRIRMIRDLIRMCEFSANKLADQIRTIIKKSWFFDLEILEIHQKRINKIIIQYQTHQVVSNKSNLPKMNC